MKVTTVTVTLVTQDDVANKNRRKLAADIQSAISGAQKGGRMKFLNNKNVESIVVTHSPYASEVRAAAAAA
jgi:predicted site-specific integrase-resolvase